MIRLVNVALCVIAMVVAIVFVRATVKSPEAIETQVSLTDDALEGKISQTGNPIGPYGDPDHFPAPEADRGTIVGVVRVLGAAKPIEEFEIEYWPIDEDGFGVVESSHIQAFRSDTGRFTLNGMSPGDWALMVTADGYQPLEVSKVSVLPGQFGDELILELARGYGITGEVIDQATGLPIVGAAIRFGESPWGRKRINMSRYTLSDSLGHFSLNGLPEGKSVLEIQAQDYANRRVSVEVPLVENIQVALVAGASLHGQVFAADNVTPVSASVRLADQLTGVGNTIQSNEMGEFKFPNLSEGRYSVSATTNAGRTSAVPVVVDDNDSLIRIALSVDASGSVYGIVDGHRSTRPLNVTAVRNQITVASGYADENGRYLLNGIPAGEIAIIVSTPQGRTITKTIEIADNESALLDFKFNGDSRLYGSINHGSGTLTDYVVRATPVDSQEVAGSGRVSKAGKYEIAGLEDGTYRVEILGETNALVYVSGETRFDLTIGTATVVGKVLDSKTRAPLSDVFVQMATRIASDTYLRKDTVSDYSGEFEFTDLKSGAYGIVLHKKGFDALFESVNVTKEAAVEEYLFELQSTSESSIANIRVRDQVSGEPLRYVAIRIGGESGIQYELRLELDNEGIGQVSDSVVERDSSIYWFGYAPTEIVYNGSTTIDIALAPIRRH